MDLKILVVDDEPNIVDILEENLSREVIQFSRPMMELRRCNWHWTKIRT